MVISIIIVHFLQCRYVSKLCTCTLLVSTEHVSHLQSALSYRPAILPIGQSAKVKKGLEVWCLASSLCGLFPSL